MRFIYFFGYRKIRKVLTGVLALVLARVQALMLVYLQQIRLLTGVNLIKLLQV